jgi:hypothetical protein
MAAGNHVELSSSAITTNTTTLSTGKSIPLMATELIIASTVSARTDGTYTVTVEHSPDGTNWFTLGATAAQSANGTVITAITVNCFHIVRASILSAAVVSGATVNVKLWYSFRA